MPNNAHLEKGVLLKHKFAYIGYVSGYCLLLQYTEEEDNIRLHYNYIVFYFHFRFLSIDWLIGV